MLKIIWCLIILIPIPSLAFATDIAVIANKKSYLTGLNKKEITALFLGRRQILKNMQAITLLDQPRDSQLRKDFFRLLNGMSPTQINSYWARLQFSGDTQPPITLSDSQSILAAVKNNPDAIGYIEADLIDNSITVILMIKNYD